MAKTHEHSDNLCSSLKRKRGKMQRPLSSASESKETELLSLHEMFCVVSSQLTEDDFEVLKHLYIGSSISDDRGKIKTPSDLFFAMEKSGLCDSSNFQEILNVLRLITRHDLIPFVTRRKRKRGVADPVDDYLDLCTSSSGPPPHPSESTSGQHPSSSSSSSLSSSLTSPSMSLSEPMESSSSSSSSSCNCSPSKQSVNPSTHPECLDSRPQACSVHSRAVATTTRCQKTVGISPEARGLPRERPKHTCDIRLRVRAEYCCHDNALVGHLHSIVRHPLRRHLDLFSQASAILKGRDLGSIVCDIKFSELTYLDAFWRDYINGSLQAALKDVFITDSLRTAVGDEAIKLLVNVDEDDYRAGRSKLLLNLIN
ncbi:death effector domain-containing protein-like [Lytechinus variegatus]|uniref:death effector domain-containing protein-like n=1 Tax=Lytechinus variegatus TaxID=7654 RepID=UPI001BB167A4|nr:death effector domain-containing protein-like [Lytechinus variegatus]